LTTKPFLNRKAYIAFGTAILILLVVGAFSYHSMALSNQSNRWARHTDEVLASMQSLLTATISMESNGLGYMLSGRDSYVESYHANVASAEQFEHALRNLTADNLALQPRLATLETLIAQKTTRTDLMLDLRRTRGMEAVLAAQDGSGDVLLQRIRALVGDLQDGELRLLAQRDLDAKWRLREAKTILVFGTILGLLITAAAGWSVRRDGLRRGFAEEALRDSEEKYRTLVHAAQDYAIFMLDPGGKVVTWNAGAERINGYSAAEIIGHNFSSLFPPDDVKRGRPEEVLHITAASGRHEEQGLRVRKDGSQFLAGVTVTALRDPTGKLQGFSEISRDLSETKESEAKYRGLLEAAPDAMVVVNQAGDIVLLNVQAEKQFGYRRDELLGQKVKNIIPQGFAERLIADDARSAAEALAQQIGTGIELSGRRKDGSEFPVELMLSPLESAEGILVTAAIRDISVRKAAEDHLVQMEGRYRGLLEAAPDAMVVVNQAGEIVLVNVQAEKRFGYRRDELLGQQVKSIIPEGFAERLIADQLRSEEDALAQQIGTGIELSGRRKDGSEFPLELMLSPLESAEGTLVTAAIRDISVRKAAEENLVQMESRYRGLLEAAPDAMVVVNQSGEIVLLNLQAEKQFGYRRDELLGQKVKNIIPEGFAERLIADRLRSEEDALAQQIDTGIELVGRRKDGTEFPLELMLSPLESPEGILVTAAIRDITTRNKAEAELLQNVQDLNRSNEELEQFANIASHDLQEPLRMVASYTQLLSRRYKGKLDADADEFIAYAVDGASRMQRLIQDLLAYSRVGSKAGNLLDTSSEDALRQALQNLRGVIEESGALVTHDPLPTVMADEIQLIQLFQNLIGNAIKYQNSKVPRVQIGAIRAVGKKWTFSVQDNGLGIESQYFEKIFGMFQRLHKREEFAGTGIGLAICKKIVERHGGRISVESQVGEGSTFRFALAESDGKS